MRALTRAGLVLACLLFFLPLGTHGQVFDNQCPVGQSSMVPMRTVNITTGHFNDTVCADIFGNLSFLALNASLTASDTFTRANGALGSNWKNTFNSFTVSTNAAKGVTLSQWNNALWADPSFVSTAQFSQITVASVNGTLDLIGASVFLATTGNVGYTCSEKSTDIYIYKLVPGGGQTQLVTSATTGAAGDILRLEVSAAGNFTCYKNGVSILTVTDTSYRSGSPGISNFSNVATLNNWSGGNLPVSQGTGPYIPVITTAQLDGITYVDGTLYPRTRAGVQLAINSNCSGGACYIILPSGSVYTWDSTPLTINQNNIHLMGDGYDTTVITTNSATADYITLTGRSFELAGMTFNASVTRTAGNVVTALGGALYGFFHDLRLSNTFGGFRLGGAGGASPSGSRFYRITNQTSTGVNAGSFYSFCGGDGTAMADIYVEDTYSQGNGALYSAPQILLDSGCDTIKFINYDMGYSSTTSETQPVIKVQNAVPTFPPRYVRFVTASIECGSTFSGNTADGVQLVDTADFSMSDSYLANCVRAVNISGGASMHGGIRFVNNHILNNQSGGIYVTSAVTAGLDLEIIGNTFSGNSIATTNTTDDIQIAANTTKFKIVGNTFSKTAFSAANSSRFGINILAGTSNLYTIADNNCTAADMGTGCISDNGTGAAKDVRSPNLFTTVTATGGSAAPKYTLQDNAGRCGLLAGPESVNNMQIGTCSAGQFLDLIQNGTTGARLNATQLLFNNVNASGTTQALSHVVQDTATLAAGTVTVTFTGSAVFTNAISYTCIADDDTAIAATRVLQNSGSSITITGTGTDVIRYICIGN